METVFSISELLLSMIAIILFVALFVGLVKPSKIMFWSNKPSRLKVFGWWVISTFALSILLSILDSVRLNSVTDEEKIESAKDLIQKQRYKEAISSLNSLDSFNLESRQLSNFADSLFKIENAQRQLLLDQKEQERIVLESKAQKELDILEVEQLKEQLITELKSLRNGVDFTSYRGSIEKLELELVLLGSWAKIVLDAESSENNEVKSLASKLRAKLGEVQIKEFPKLRKEYGRIMGKKLWENDLVVSTNGTGHRYINFSGGLFAANKNKKDFQSLKQKELIMFRFKQSRYRWYEKEKEYTYYEMDVDKDSDLMEFR